ncbi:MAG: hypothetical protein ACRDKH_01505 [Solirubrobacterales bacterium]
MPTPRSPRTAAVLAALVLAGPLAACGSDEEDLVEEASLRECLGGALEIEPPGASAADQALGSASPDFTATTGGGVEVDAIVEAGDRDAERVAADVQAALLSFGVTDADVLQERNAVVVIAGDAGASERAAIEDCLEA